MVWFCGTTGAVLEVAIAAFNTSEWKLARQLYSSLESDDVVVADSAYGTYADLAPLSVEAVQMPCFVNTMRVGVISVEASGWALGTTLSDGSARNSVRNQ